MRAAWALGLVTALWAPLAAGFAPRVQGVVVWPNAGARVQRGLAAADVVERRNAAAQLFSLLPSAQRRLLPQALGDADPQVRLAAAGVALQIAFPAAQYVVTWLRDADARLRQMAAELLTVAPDARALPDLVRALGDGEAAVRAAVARALGATGSEEATLPLLGRSDDVDGAVREQVLLALASLGDQRATLPLIGKLQDPRPAQRKAVARTLARLKDSRALPALVLALADSEVEVKVAVLDALGEIGAAGAVAAVLPYARSLEQEELAQAALRALARMNNAQAAAALVQVLTSADPELAALAAQVMPHATPAVVEPLAECLTGQPSEAAANACASALTKVKDARSGPLVLSALERRLVSPQLGLAALAEVGYAPALASALEFLGAPDAQTQLAAADLCVALLDSAVPDGRAVDPLARALASAQRDTVLQQRLLRALGRTASPRAAPQLLPFLQARRVGPVKMAAVEAAGFVGGRELGLALVPLLDDPDAALRWTTALALRRIAEGATLAPLWQRLTQEPSQDRVALALALGGPLRTLSDARQAAALLALIRQSRAELADVLIESASFVPGQTGVRLLSSLSDASLEAATQAKVAEALAGHTQGKATLTRLASAREPRVRANAVWAMGGSLAQADVTTLRDALADSDHAVAANAVAALARTQPGGEPLRALLCDALRDERAYVRVNALTGLRLREARCDDGRELQLLARDLRSKVREAAARLLVAVPGPQAAVDAKALQRCAAEDREASVAHACAGASAAAVTAHAWPLTVLVVPHGEDEPVPDAPFALVRSDGFVRCGWADRRGAVFEPQQPAGSVELAVPAPWVAPD